MAKRNRDTERAGRMRSLLQDLDDSGLSVREFARQRDIATSRIWYWRKRFRDDENPPAPAPSEPSPLVPVAIRPETSSASTSLVVEINDRRIHVPADFDSDVLRRVVLALDAC